MTALSADNTTLPSSKLVSGPGGNGFHADYGVAATTVIFKHGFVGWNVAGFLKMYEAPLSQATDIGDRFVGISMEPIASQTSAGDATCRVMTDGIFEWALASAVIADIGKPVYALDSATLTKAGAGNAYVGHIVSFVSAGIVLVKMPGLSALSPGGFIARTSASIDLTSASDVVQIIHPTENHNGLLIATATMFLGATTGATAAVVTLRDTASTTTTITFTSDVDAGGDIISPAANTVAIEGTLGSALVPVPADLGLEAFVTTASETGTGKITLMAYVL